MDLFFMVVVTRNLVVGVTLCTFYCFISGKSKAGFKFEVYYYFAIDSQSL